MYGLSEDKRRIDCETAGRLPVLLLSISTVCALATRAWGAEAPAATERAEVLEVSGARPVAAAVSTLVERYGYRITYEDPRYIFDGDVKDVTSEVRRDLEKYESGKAPRVLVPAGGTITLNYAVSKATDLPRKPEPVMRALLAAHAARQGAEMFRLERSGDDVFHIIPARVRDKTGHWVEQESILDVPVTLSASDLNGYQMVEAICEYLGAATRTRIEVGSFPVNALVAYRANLAADNERARDVLLRVLNDTGRELTWSLSYNPGLGWYLLNIGLVPDLQHRSKKTPATPPGIRIAIGRSSANQS